MFHSTASIERTSRRFRAIDVLRGLACLMIVVFHSSFYLTDNPTCEPSTGFSALVLKCIDHLWIGIALFLAISGYCLTGLCEVAMEKGTGTWEFMTRRFRRIFPPYWVVLLLLLAVFGAFRQLGLLWLLRDSVHPVVTPSQLSAGQWLGNITLIEGFRQNLGGSPRLYFFAPAWFISYAVQYYVLCGFLTRLGAARFYRAIGVLSLCAILAMGVHHLALPLPIDGLFLDHRWLLFAAGVLTFYRIHHARKEITLLTNGALIASLLGTIAWYVGTLHSAVPEELSVALVFALVMPVIHRFDERIDTMTLFRPMLFCGTISYSLYLIHWPLVKVLSLLCYRWGLDTPWSTLLLTIPFCIAVSVLAGWAFYAVVECRFHGTKAYGREKPRRAVGIRSALANQPTPSAVAREDAGR